MDKEEYEDILDQYLEFIKTQAMKDWSPLAHKEALPPYQYAGLMRDSLKRVGLTENHNEQMKAFTKAVLFGVDAVVELSYKDMKETENVPL